MSVSPYRVSTLIQALKQCLDQQGSFTFLWCIGEISNFTAHHSGHWYFSLKDETARISCVMFQNAARQVAFKPKNGDKVLIQGSISIYPAQGQLQCQVFAMRLDGEGDLMAQFESLKQKLRTEGLFDPEHKKALPRFPINIGIITGMNTAALQDILKSFKEQWPIAQLTVYSSLVQGEQASQQLIERLAEADQAGHDLIIMARGGGSIEDLWPFNSEALAYAIYQAQTVVVTGIGHETDSTIADFVSDLRAPTPSGAVLLSVPNYQDLCDQIRMTKSDLSKAMLQKLNQTSQLVSYRTSQLMRLSPLNLIHRHQIQIYQFMDKFKQEVYQFKQLVLHFRDKQNGLLNLADKSLKQFDYRLQKQYTQLIQSSERLLDHKKNEFTQSMKLLEAYSPLQNLIRGYSIVSLKDKVVKSIHDVSVHDEINIQLKDGKIRSVISEIGENHE